MAKKKKCTSGFSCGRSCIQRSRTCRSNLGANGKKVVENYTQFLNRIQSESQAKIIGERVQQPVKKEEPIKAIEKRVEQNSNISKISRNLEDSGARRPEAHYVGTLDGNPQYLLLGGEKTKGDGATKLQISNVTGNDGSIQTTLTDNDAIHTSREDVEKAFSKARFVKEGKDVQSSISEKFFVTDEGEGGKDLDKLDLDVPTERKTLPTVTAVGRMNGEMMYLLQDGDLETGKMGSSDNLKMVVNNNGGIDTAIADPNSVFTSREQIENLFKDARHVRSRNGEEWFTNLG